jgi:arylsulfatase A-like enzyme
VNAFLYSPLLNLSSPMKLSSSSSSFFSSSSSSSPSASSQYSGVVYDGIMHVSDWFPTILELAGISVGSRRDELVVAAIDGVSQVQAMRSGSSDDNQRKYLLYNAYVNIEGRDFEINTHTNAAIRNQRYKLIHGYVDNEASQWYAYNSSSSIINSNDSSADSEGYVCRPSMALEGNFSFMLYDLQDDPYELNNLYHNITYQSIRVRYITNSTYNSQLVVIFMSASTYNDQ